MDRREFLHLSLATMAGHWVSSGLGQAAAMSASPDWTLGWRGIGVDRLAPTSMRVDGTIPAAVHGSLYRNGPARIERAGVRYRHWFDGDGMIQHFRLDASGARHEGRFVQTPKYVEEQAAGRFLYGAAGTELPDERPSRNNDTGNVANTALLPWNDELLALWEGGSAYRIDPEDLSTIGRKDWRDDLKHMPFSAHPLIEADGTLWNLGSAPYVGSNGMIFVYRIAPDGTVIAAEAIETPIASYMHSFAMTKRYLLFYLTPHRFQRGAATFVDSFDWSPELGSKVLLVDKNNLSSRRLYEAPAGFTFHFAHAFERGHEVIARFALYDTAEIMSQGMVSLLNVRAGQAYPDFPRAYLASLHLDTRSGRARVDPTDTLIEFPGIDPRRVGASTAVFGVGHDPASSPTYSDAIVRVDPESGAVSRYSFPPHQIVEEPLFVAEPGNDADGWLVGTFLDYARERTGVYVLNASNLEDGPVALATMDRRLPLGFHGCFIPRA